MDNKKPILSICMPTYNRADVLDKSIASLVIQPEFESDDVELIISDNASSDNTEAVVKKYQKQYRNIYYFKNCENIHDKNCSVVIGKAHGIFRKLCNDTLLFKQSAVRMLIDVVKTNVVKKPVLFFLNGVKKNKNSELYKVNDFDTFVKSVSFYSTWIASFGVWEDDYNAMDDKYSGHDLSLWHTKVLFEMCLNKDEYLIDNSKLFDVQNPEKKNLSYGLYKVFYENYLGLYEKYLFANILSKKTFYFLKKDLLFSFFSRWIINIKYAREKYILTESEDLYHLIMNAYKCEKYFIFFWLDLQLLIIKRYAKKIIKRYAKKNHFGQLRV